MPTRPRPETFAKRSLGQNFLVDQGAIARIIAALGPEEGDTIFEIGPGRGALTEPLVQTGAKITAFELDTFLARALSEQFSGVDNFRVVEADALEIKLAAYLPASRRAKLVANLPYNISTAILQRLAEQREHLSKLVLMLQKEVIDRIAAPPASALRGYLTVIVEAAFEVTPLFDIPPVSFRPVPKVTSTVAEFIPRPKDELACADFNALVSTAFGQKRKTILNNLKGTYGHAAAALEGAGIEARRRAETLELSEWRALFRAISSPPAPPLSGKEAKE